MAQDTLTGSTEILPPQSIRKVISASSMGTLIEWYDLFVAIILAGTLAAKLFPPNSGFLDTLGVLTPVFLDVLGSLGMFFHLFKHNSYF